MSTRCNVMIRDSSGDKLWFYRHSDGYPSVTGESLKRFLRWLIDGKIRNNVGQASGWLVLLGAVEYQTLGGGFFPEHGKSAYDQDHDIVERAASSLVPHDWKCGAYEPTVAQHGDIEYLYVIDLDRKIVQCSDPKGRVFWTIDEENIDSKIKEPEKV